MNRFRVIGIAFFIIAIILIGCAPEHEARVVRKTPLPEADDFTGAAAAGPEAEDGVDEAGDDDDAQEPDIKEMLEKNIGERQAETDEEEEDETEDTPSDEYLRELKYMYLIDLTTLTPGNCDLTEMGLKADLLAKRNELEDTEEDIQEGEERLADKQAIYEEKVQAYNQAVSGGDETEIDYAKREMIDAKDDMDEKEEEISDLRDELEDVEDNITDLEETLEKVRDECKHLKTRG